jgi:hypothetical protein
MDEIEYQALQTKIDNLEDAISEEVSTSTMDMVYELIELNLQLEEHCNK